jgi:RNA polymerase sigma-32 factor
MLTADEEYMLGTRWQEHGDTEAAHKLVTSHLRLVAKIAMGYRGYGLPVSDLISEGTIGLMQAVKKFDPDKGFRLSTYAMWWVKASMQEYILHSWSMVKIGTTSAQKKLFFSLRRLKAQMKAIEGGDLTPEQVAYIAKELSVSEDEVIQMNGRLSGRDHSLNKPLTLDSDGEWQDFLMDESQDQETIIANEEEASQRHLLLSYAMDKLNDRERDILEARRLSEDPMTLEELSQKYDISRERVRQIESRAFEKVQDIIRGAANDDQLPSAN